ncbi:sensor histidine kinase [Hyphomonas chukchiensis]|jgi:signal transduction histidine kinase|uniref:histidine kinase n=1 Tax=Hyphomonas chukchiensis TaxID=1280947 RepID=A0A062UCT6_9PROT|nr:sensor histidine kinase [Hyphomonas chukchiensis]KCZ53955.1 hypothetical protein HY30_10670 [Hyphomonas chukchiensis]|tara:strand:+ start:2112 stop:4328 length:2217 start_codon:yes stop_codon:yes gene_type:complete
MAREQLSFETDAAIIARLGQELVAKQETALAELVKNAFDADATDVVVRFSNESGKNLLEIIDNGLGMSRKELLAGFMRLASDTKAQEPKSKKFKRKRAGRKGIGRFAAQRLGARLELTTRAKGEKDALRLIVDWSKFSAGTNLEDVSVFLEPAERTSIGTSLVISDLRDDWSDSQIRRCWRTLIALQKPFPVAPVSSAPSDDPGFQVKFFKQDSLFSDDTLVVDLKTEILDHLHALIEVKVDEVGAARFRIQKNRFGEARPWRKIHHLTREGNFVPNYEHLKNVSMKAYYVVLDPSLLPSIVYTRVRDVLGREGGIRLYRNGFRVVPYGEPGDDWLGLGVLYAKRSMLAPIANRNFFGVVEIEDPDVEDFEEHTSREGLIETPAFVELRSLLSSALGTATQQLAEDRGRKTRAGRATTPPAKSDERFSALTESLRDAREAANEVAQQTKTPAAQNAAKKTAQALRLVQSEIKELEHLRSSYADESAMLRFLATLGMTTAEFSHETGMTFDAVRLDFSYIFERAEKEFGQEKKFIQHAERAKGMLARLDTLTSYLNTLAASRSLREISSVSMARAISDFERGVRDQARAQSIELEISIPEYDALFTKPIHGAEVASVLLNFYTNAVKAVRRGGGKRRMLISAERETGKDGRIRVLFCDSGDGIPDSAKSKIFDAFFTTSSAPSSLESDSEHSKGTGLGLWIVRQIAENSGGDVRVVAPPKGYSTCFQFALPAEDEDGRD